MKMMLVKNIKTIFVAASSFFLGYTFSCVLSFSGRANNVLESIIIEKDTSTSGSAIKNRITAAVVSTKKDMAMLQAESAVSSAQEIDNQKQKVSHQLQQEKLLSNSTKLNTTVATELTAVIPREEESVLSSFADVQFQKETAVVISTHLIPSHPSLSLLLEVLDSVRTYLVGLPEKCPVFITIDGIQEKYAESKEDNLFLSADKSNREKYDSYIRALNRHFKDEDNVKILIAGKNIGLAENLRRVVENLHPSTKYMYLMQHDLPFAKEINHTAIVKTANEHPEINIVRFNFKKSIAKPNECSGVPEINANGISLKKWIKWSDQNQFARVSHYVNEIFPILSHHTFPEMKMIEMAHRNCTHYGLYYYAKGYGGPWYKHTDATERYGSKLAERVKRGELHVSALSDANLREMKRAGVNITELFQVSKTTRE